MLADDSQGMPFLRLYELILICGRAAVRVSSPGTKQWMSRKS